MDYTWALLALTVVGIVHGVSGKNNHSYGSRGSARPGNGQGNQANDVCYPVSTPSTFPTPNEGCFPNVMKNPVPADPVSRQGRYFEYSSRFATEQVYNAQYVNSLVCDGLIYLPATNTPAVHWTQTYRYFTLSKGQGPSSGSTYGTSVAYGSGYEQKAGYGQDTRHRVVHKPQSSCNYQFIDIIGAYDGVDFFRTFDPELANAQPIQEVAYLLFVKPGERGFEIQYGCSLPNQQTHVCQKVSVFVNTRVHPSQLTRKEQHEVDATVDRVLAPYCMSKDDLQKVIHRDDLPIEQCNLAPLEAFTSLVKGYASSLPKRQAGLRKLPELSASSVPVGKTYMYSSRNSTLPSSPGNASSSFPTLNKGCFPNILPNPVAGDPFKRVGTYYEYRSRGALEQVYNAGFTNQLVTSKLVYLPGTLIPVVHLSQTYLLVYLSNGQRCSPDWASVLCRPEGQCLYTQFAPIFGPLQPVLSVLYYLYEDTGPKGFEINYSCDVRNFATGVCDQPAVYVNTRVHPNFLSTQEQLALDDTIDRVLRPFCFSKVDLQKVIHRSDLQPCDLTPTQTFNEFIAGLNSSLTGP